MKLSIKQFIIASRVMEEICRSAGEKRMLTLREVISKVYKDLDDDLNIQDNRKNAERDLQNFIESLMDATKERLARHCTLKDDYSAGDFRLYHENGHCSLDPLGKIFLDGSKKITNLFYELLGDMGNQISHQGNSHMHKIRIGTTHTLGIYPAPKIVSEFNSVYNNSIAFKVMSGSSSQIKEWLCSQLIDVGFVSDKVENYRGYDNFKMKLFEEPLCVCPKSVVNKYLDSKGILKDEGMAEANKLPLIYFTAPSSWRSRIEGWITEGKLEPSSVLYEIDNMEIIMSMVDKGMGRSVIPSKALYRDKDRPLYSNIFCYKKIDEKLLTRVIILKEPDRFAKKFVEFMLERGYCY